MRKRPTWRLNHRREKNLGPDATRQSVVSRNGHEQAKLAQGDRSQAIEAISDVTFWDVIGGGLCLLALLTFLLSGFWQGFGVGS